MSVLIGSWEFEGPFSDIQDLRHEPGIVAVLARSNDELELVEIDESDSVKDFLEKRMVPKFSPSDIDGFSTAVYYCSDLNATLRQGLVEELMKEFGDDDQDYNA
jgi:citrate synthase